MPSTPCRFKGCSGLVNSRLKRGYCDKHAHLRTQSNWSNYQQIQGNTTERGYGHAWRKRRAEVLSRDKHLCQVCLVKGYFTPATEVDHIINKANGGTDDIANLQSICKTCHKTKTQQENQSENFVFMPEWLEPIPNAIIVFGCCGSGKTTWAKEHRNGHTIVDLDQIIAKSSGNPLYIRNRAEFATGVRIRNRLLLSLAKNNKPCIILLTGKSEYERQWWINKIQPKQTVILRVPTDECVRRIKADKNRPEEVKIEQINSVYDWRG